MREKWRFRFWGIRAKTIFACCLMSIFAVLLAGALSFALGYRNLREASTQELLEHARQIAAREAQTTEALVVPTWERLETYQELTDALVFFVDTDYVAVHVPQGETLDEEKTRAITMRTKILNAFDQQFTARVLMGETVTESRYSEMAGSEVLFIGIPLSNTQDVIVGGLILMQPIQKVVQLWIALGLTLMIAGSLSVGLSILLSTHLARAMTRPLVEIAQVARRISEGDYQARVEASTADEAGKLGQALNAFAARMDRESHQMREERDQFEFILGSIDEGIVAVDTSWRIVRFNRAFLELMEIECIDQLESRGGDGAVRLNKMMREAMFSRKHQRGTWVGPSGRDLLAVVSPVFGRNREILGSVALLQDVSESERLEQLRRDYVANISHELRTPLTGIRGMVEPLMDGCVETEEEKADFYQVIYRETLRLEKLIGEMLDVSRLQDGRVTLDTEPVDVRYVVDTALRRVQATADQAGIALSAELPDGDLLCMGDENRILQVLTIFLDNALGFTPPEGSVAVYARPERDTLRLGVIDSGVGIEPKDLPFIWERFYKSDKSRMRTSGTGLGLAIAKLVVELMGGEIGVDTEPGKGSEFYFILKRPE